MITLRIALACVVLVAANASHAAEPYPARPVRVIVTAAPGGIVDITARVISTQLSEQLGKIFVIENRTGAGGIVGTAFAAKATADGYTLLLATPGFTIVPGLHRSLPYDVIKDFTAITQISGATQVLVVNPALNTATLKDFIALARANPGKFNYGSGGPGSPLHVYAELFAKAANLKLMHVPYKGGGGESMSALMSGEIQMLFAAIPTALGLIKTGKVRALAVTTGGKRLASMPDVPSMGEAGINGMAIDAIYGFVGPAGIPKPVVNRLHAEVVKAIAVASVRERFKEQDAELIGSSPDVFAKLLASEVRRSAQIIQAAGIRAE